MDSPREGDPLLITAADPFEPTTTIDFLLPLPRITSFPSLMTSLMTSQSSESAGETEELELFELIPLELLCWVSSELALGWLWAGLMVEWSLWSVWSEGLEGAWPGWEELRGERLSVSVDIAVRRLCLLPARTGSEREKEILVRCLAVHDMGDIFANCPLAHVKGL